MGEADMWTLLEKNEMLQKKFKYFALKLFKYM